MPGQIWSDRLKSPVFQIAILLVIAILLGGGGVAYGLNNLVLQLVSLALLAINRKACVQFWREAPLALKVLIGATLALPLLQLIPLPFNAWTALPGRELAREAFMASGGPGWHAFSLDPARTLVAALGLIAPVTILMLGWRVTRRDMRNLSWAVAALGLANFLLGVPQVLSQGHLAMFYPENPMPGVLFGSFANRNSTGLFLVACLCLISLTVRDRENATTRLVRIALATSLIVGIILTQSRSAMVLMMLPIGLSGLRWLRDNQHAKWGWIIIGGGVAVLAFALLLSLNTPNRIGSALERFENGGDTRMQTWEDAAYSAQRYWPLGAGMGTFDEVFQADESLEHLSPRKAGRAHNDYLEIAIEAGMPGLLLIAAWLTWVGWRIYAARVSSTRWQAWAGGTILVAIALQSITDYPLRNQAMLALGAFAVLLLLNRQPPTGEAA